jgi:hypothetical protein
VFDYIIKDYSNQFESWNLTIPRYPNNDDWNVLGIDNDIFKSWTTLLHKGEDLRSRLEIEMIEYYDTTDYLNIIPSNPRTVKETVYTSGSYEEPFLNASGDIEYLPPVTTITGSYEIDTGVLQTTGGNQRFWEYASADNLTDIEDFYRKLGLIDETQDITTVENFLSGVWDIFSQDHYNVNPDLNLADQSDYDTMQAKYSNIAGEESYSPYINHTSTDYTTVAIHPFIWNLVEKYTEVFPAISQITVDQPSIEFQRSLEIIDFDNSTSGKYDVNNTFIEGMIFDSWKNRTIEYAGYESEYETSLNYDFNVEENQSIDVDGPFNMDALNDLLNDTFPSLPSGPLDPSLYRATLTAEFENQYFTDIIGD